MVHPILGGSAKAAGELISKQGGKTIEYLFIVELLFLNGGSKLDAPVYSIIQTDDWFSIVNLLLFPLNQ
jgi:adenine phosphoribosyltransferase